MLSHFTLSLITRCIWSFEEWPGWSLHLPSEYCQGSSLSTVPHIKLSCLRPNPLSLSKHKFWKALISTLLLECSCTNTTLYETFPRLFNLASLLSLLFSLKGSCTVIFDSLQLVHFHHFYFLWLMCIFLKLLTILQNYIYSIVYFPQFQVFEFYCRLWSCCLIYIWRIRYTCEKMYVFNFVPSHD